MQPLIEYAQQALDRHWERYRAVVRALPAEGLNWRPGDETTNSLAMIVRQPDVIAAGREESPEIPWGELEPVVAAADGRVVYAGAGLRGYGNLIIIKHNNTFLTAYAHNKKLLVKEDQNVKKGQEIAEMGSSDADRVKLHFEIRRSGKPVDPARYLPAA